MKMLKNRFRKDRLINKLRNENRQLAHKLAKCEWVKSLYAKDAANWEDEKISLLEIKRKYVLLLEAFELNDEKFNKILTGISGAVSGKYTIIISDKK